MSKVIIIGGGTFSHIRNHLALAAPAFGTTARIFKQHLPNAQLILTRMASESSNIVTLDDLWDKVNVVLQDKWVKYIVMNAAICDFDGTIGSTPSGAHATRLKSREEVVDIKLTRSKKLIEHIATTRPDIKIVGFKTTVSANALTQVTLARDMGVWAVIANDMTTRNNVLVNASDVVADERENILKLAASLIEADQQQILFENDHVVTVDLKPNGYMSRVHAAIEAAKILKCAASDIVFAEWSLTTEGVALFRKVNSLTTD